MQTQCWDRGKGSGWWLGVFPNALMSIQSSRGLFLFSLSALYLLYFILSYAYNNIWHSICASIYLIVVCWVVPIAAAVPLQNLQKFFHCLKHVALMFTMVWSSILRLVSSLLHVSLQKNFRLQPIAHLGCKCEMRVPFFRVLNSSFTLCFDMVGI